MNTPSKSHTQELMDELLSIFPERLLKLNNEEQRISLKIYELLSRGRPVSISKLAMTVHISENEVNDIVSQWPGVFKNQDGDIISYWGLGLTEMLHQIQIGGNTLYNWCAWDSLFIPALLDKTAYITSVCPVTKEKIKLIVSKHGVEYEPASTVMSFVKPQSGIKIDENVITNFCHKIHFFSSEEAAAKWVAENPETFVISVEDAFSLGQKKNELSYKNVRSVHKEITI